MSRMPNTFFCCPECKEKLINTGSKDLVERIVTSKSELSSEELVKKILENIGELEVSDQTHEQLLEIAS